MINNHHRIQKTLLVISSLCIPILSHGEIIRDGTIGNNASSTLSATNNLYEILEEMGEKYGSNLLHSFEKFEILSGETAHFISDDSVIENIISRVTGADQSTIDGLLKSDKNFYLINPNGVIFGPNGSLDINGSFKISTSDSLIFDNGAIFAIDQPINTALLSTASPTEFGFLNSNSGDITFTGGNYHNADSDIFLNAKNITLENGAVLFTVSEGDIALSALEGISLSGQGTNIQSYNTGNGSTGNIILSGSENINISDGAFLLTRSDGEGVSGNIDLNDNQNISLTEEGSAILSYNTANGQSGDITISDSQSIDITNDASIRTVSEGSGNSGNINLDKNQNITFSGEGTSVESYNISDGSSGDINITNTNNFQMSDQVKLITVSDGVGTSGNLTLNKNKSISISDENTKIQSHNRGNGATGDITLSGSENINFSNGASLLTQADGEGTSGDIIFNNNDSISLSGEETTIKSYSTTNSQSGDIIFTNSGDIELSDSSSLLTTSSGEGGGTGNITIDSNNISIFDESTISITGDNINSENIRINTDTLLIGDIEDTRGFSRAGIFTESFNSLSNTSNIDIKADNIQLLGEAYINSITNAPVNNSGNISIETDQLLIQKDSDISSTTQYLGGDAGDISIKATDIQLLDGAQINSVTNADEGNAGNITIETDNLLLRGGIDDSYDTVISSEARVDAPGDSGSISIIASENIAILNGGYISSSTSNLGKAGDVTVEAKNIVIQDNIDSSDDTGIFSETNYPYLDEDDQDPTGDAGSITVTASEGIKILDGGKISTSSSANGNAGEISISTPSLLIDQGNSDATTGILSQADEESIIANAGKITISGVDENAIDISLKNGATIRSNVDNNIGSAGTISIDNAGEVILENNASISTQTRNDFNPDNPAQIQLKADTLRLEQDSTITTQANGEATAGNIDITTNNTNLLNDSSITTESEQGKGGNINLTVTDRLITVNSDIISNANGEEDGGNITINANLGVFVDSNILAQGANGGAIDINIPEGRGFKVGKTEINAESTREDGVDGIINAGNIVEIEEKLEEDVLDTSFTDASSLIRKSCSAYSPNSQFNVFNQTGVSASPDSLLPSIDPIMHTRLAEINQNDNGLIALNQGSITFRNGELDKAKEHWTEAVAFYAQSGDNTAQADALRGVAQVQQSMGEYTGSIQTLAQAVDIARRGGDQTRLAESLGSLGNALIAAGNPGSAEEMLTQAIQIAEETRDRSLSARLNNNLGNYYTVNNKVDKALERYLQSVDASIETDQYTEATKAYANIARLNIYELEAANALGALQQAEALINAMEANGEKANLHIHLAKSYGLLADTKASYQSSLQKAFGHLQQAKSLSEQLDDQRLLSYALGNMGSLYQLENRPKEALTLTRQALALAEQTNTPESLYRWHWQEAQLLRDKGKNQAAVDAYQRAITIIEDSRQTTLARYESADVHFKQQVQPVYKELADLLIQVSVREDNDAFSQQLLLDTRDVMEQLKTAELENYFHDECIANLQTKRTDLDQVSPKAAVVYPIVLEDRLELLISLPDLSNPYQRTLARRAVPISATDITTQAQTFRNVVESIGSTLSQHHKASQPFYNWLVSPYEDDLKKHNVDTLVFVPDGMLRTLPMSALHNGDNYLIEDYAVATTSSLALTDPQPLAEKNNRVLLAGVSESVNGLPALEAVPGELGAVNDLFNGDVLLDDEFTAEAFTQQVKKENYSIIHIASHAQFTGDERNSFLQAYDQTLSMDGLKTALNTTKYRDQPLEMLVLSACETASGDERSALGLAGVGIKAGARSAMGSLWSVPDDSAAELIEQFYTELHDNKLSKAHALRQAQLSLLAQDRYSDPAHWSAFMIIDNWL